MVNHVTGNRALMWIHKLKCEQTERYRDRTCRSAASPSMTPACYCHCVPSYCRLYVNVDARVICLLSFSPIYSFFYYYFFIYTWLSMISCRSLRITDWQGFLVHWHIMTLQLLHRRGGGTFGQTEREAGMKQKLLIQVRIDLLYNYQKKKKKTRKVKHICTMPRSFLFLFSGFLVNVNNWAEMCLMSD